MSYLDLINIMDKVEGQITHDEGIWLYNAARNTQEGFIVEIGSWKGRSTVMLSLGSPGILVHAIDPHKDTYMQDESDPYTYDDCETNVVLYGNPDNVKFHVKTSEEAASEIKSDRSNKPCIGLIFIDGDHSYESVKLDYDLYYPKVMSGGIMAFHDSTNPNWPGVKRLMKEVFNTDQYFLHNGIAGSIAWGIKR